MANDDRQFTPTGTQKGSAYTGGTLGKSETKGPGREGGTNKPSAEFSFRCSDVGQQCSWQTHGSNEDEVLNNVERHAREQHNMASLDDDTRNRVRGAIRREAA